MSIVLSLKLEKGKSVLRGQDHFWTVIMDLDRAGKPFTVHDIDQGSNANKSAIREFVQRLENGGVVERLPLETPDAPVTYRAKIRQSKAPRVRRDGSLIESQPATRCMWNMMRGPIGRNGFTFQDLVNWSQTDETQISVHTARSYIKVLNAAGYLLVVRHSRPGTPAIWRLNPKMNTGPQAPMILRTRMVFDPNREEIFGPALAEEVEP